MNPIDKAIQQTTENVDKELALAKTVRENSSFLKDLEPSIGYFTIDPEGVKLDPTGNPWALFILLEKQFKNQGYRVYEGNSTYSWYVPMLPDQHIIIHKCEFNEEGLEGSRPERPRPINLPPEQRKILFGERYKH